MKHKHADVLIAIAEGKAVQWKSTLSENWQDANFKSYTPITHDDLEWRIKPEPKHDVYLYTYSDGNSGCYSISNFQKNGDNLKLIVDGETGKLKSAEVIS